MAFNRNVKKFLIENQKFGSQRHTTISDFELYVIFNFFNQIIPNYLVYDIFSYLCWNPKQKEILYKITRYNKDGFKLSQLRNIEYNIITIDTKIQGLPDNMRTRKIVNFKKFLLLSSENNYKIPEFYHYQKNLASYQLDYVSGMNYVNLEIVSNLKNIITNNFRKRFKFKFCRIKFFNCNFQRCDIICEHSTIQFINCKFDHCQLILKRGQINIYNSNLEECRFINSQKWKNIKIYNSIIMNIKVFIKSFKLKLIESNFWIHIEKKKINFNSIVYDRMQISGDEIIPMIYKFEVSIDKNNFIDTVYFEIELNKKNFYSYEILLNNNTKNWESCTKTKPYLYFTLISENMFIRLFRIELFISYYYKQGSTKIPLITLTDNLIILILFFIRSKNQEIPFNIMEYSRDKFNENIGFIFNFLKTFQNKLGIRFIGIESCTSYIELDLKKKIKTINFDGKAYKFKKSKKNNTIGCRPDNYENFMF